MVPKSVFSQFLHSAKRNRAFVNQSPNRFNRMCKEASSIRSPSAFSRLPISRNIEKNNIEGQTFGTCGVYRIEGHGYPLRRFRCSSSITSIHEVEEDFDAESCMQVRSYSKYACPPTNTNKLSIRIELPKAGLLDKEEIRERRTQPFTEKCWMQSLGVGLYRHKMKNRKGYSTAAIPCNREKKDGELTLSGSNGNVETEGDDKENEVGVIDTDSDEDDQDYCDSSKPGSSSAIKEESVEALEASLREYEATIEAEDPRIGSTCLRLAQLYDSLDEEPEKILSYGERALKILQSSEPSFEDAMCNHVIGSAYYKMDESEKAVDHLEKAAVILKKLGTSKVREVGTMSYAIQVLLGHSKMSLGKQEDALKHYREGVLINEQLLEPGNPDLARSYQQAAEAYIEAEEHQEALNLCMKALPIYTNFYGLSSFEVAALRRLIAVIYDDLEDFENVLAQHEVIRPILVKLGRSKEVASLDLQSGEALISLEKYKDAIVKLKDVVKETKETSRFHGHALVLIGKAYAEMEENGKAVKYCKKAFNALKSKKFSLEAGSSLMELGSVYQQINEPDQAMASLKLARSVFEHHPDQLGATAEIEGQIGGLLLYTGKVKEALPYLEKSVDMLETMYGKDSPELLPVYNHIAIANLELERYEDALVKFEAARVISTENHGAEDGDTIAIYCNLANTYAALERFNKAIECQKHVVAAIKKGGSQFHVTLAEAEKKLNELLKQAKP